MLLALWPRIFVRPCGPIVAIDHKNYKNILGGGRGFDRGGLWGPQRVPSHPLIWKKFDSWRWFSEMDRASSKNSFGGQYPVSSGSTK